MIETKKFVRKPLFIDAVRITNGNFDKIIEWCQGEIKEDQVPGQGSPKKYIKVRVHNPKNPRQTKAFVGDWLLYTERGYKVYTNKAFRASFDELVEETNSSTVYPYPDGDMTVLGPEIFAGHADDGTYVIAWKGENFVPQSPKVGGVIESDVPKLMTVEEARDALGYDPLPEVEEKTQLPTEVNESVVNGTPISELKDSVEDADPYASINTVPPVVSLDSAPSDPNTTFDSNAAPSTHSASMEKAIALIESEGGEVVEATPESVMATVAEQDRVRKIEEAAEGKRVIWSFEQESMDQQEIRELIMSGEAILEQDLTV